MLRNSLRESTNQLIFKLWEKKNLADINIKNTSILPSEDRAKPITIKKRVG